jgi:hypothetical protein
MERGKSGTLIPQFSRLWPVAIRTPDGRTHGIQLFLTFERSGQKTIILTVKVRQSLVVSTERTHSHKFLYLEVHWIKDIVNRRSISRITVKHIVKLNLIQSEF